MCLMYQVLKPFIGKFVVVYFGDFLIYSRSEDEHLQHLREVLTILQENQLYVNLKKCSLGFVVSVDGIHVDEEKIQVIQDWPTRCPQLPHPCNFLLMIHLGFYHHHGSYH